jgi:hypothetical protein
VSGLSGPGSAGLQPPGKADGRDITPSPSPPSPAYTPERDNSPPRYSAEEDKELERGLSSVHSERGRSTASGEHQGNRLRTTQITARTVSPDLYGASPRLPPATIGFPSHNGNGHASGSRGVAGGSGLEDDLVSRRAAELELQKRKAQEEKIYYDAETGEEPHHNDEVEAPSMSATSYPGMEW